MIVKSRATQSRRGGRRYGIPYNSGSLPKQFGTVVRKIIRRAVPPRPSGVKPKERDLIAA